jgi:hypothetical protein
MSVAICSTRAPDNNDGNAIANLTYRITALYIGRDSVLGASAGLKHFGIRRLGRSGLSNRLPLAEASSPTDNVWDIDCSSFFPPEVGGGIQEASPSERPQHPDAGCLEKR